MGQARNLVGQWWDAFEDGRLDDIARLCHSTVEVTLPGGSRLVGPAAVNATLGAFREAFPDLRHEIRDAVDAGDKVAVELTVTGTHTGAFRTPDGHEIPPTGRAVVWESVDVVTVCDGKITSWHTYFDQVAFLVQLGLMPEPMAS